MGQIISVENKAGEPIQFGATRLAPFSQCVRVQIPGLRGGIIWNRPLSVLVTHADGDEEVIPVPDITRIVIWSLLGAAALSWLLTRFNR